MPKVGTRTIKLGTHEIKLGIFYFVSKEDSDHSFFATVPEQWRKPSSITWDRETNRGKDYIGASGDTEAEAVANAKAKIEEYMRLSTERVDLILIQAGKRKDMFDYSSRGKEPNTDKNKSEVRFTFYVAYAHTLDGETKYYKNEQYHPHEGHNYQVYHPEEFTHLPFSEERLAQCELLVKQMQEMDRRILMMFDMEADAGYFLDSVGRSSSLLLLQSPDPTDA
jgi:hypothetical protein